MHTFKYSYCLLNINSITKQSVIENNERLKREGYANYVVEWDDEQNYYLNGDIQCLYTDKKRTAKQIKEDNFQQLFLIASQNYDQFRRNEEDDDFEDVTVSGNENGEMRYTTKYGNKFYAFVSNNSFDNQNENFEITVVVPKGFTSITLIVSAELRNLIVKTEDGKVLKEVHSSSKTVYGCYIDCFNVSTIV